MRLISFKNFSKASMLFFVIGCGAERAPPIDICSISMPQGVAYNAIEVEDIRVHCVMRDGSHETKDVRDLDEYLASPFGQATDYYEHCSQKNDI